MASYPCKNYGIICRPDHSGRQDDGHLDRMRDLGRITIALDAMLKGRHDPEVSAR